MSLNVEATPQDATERSTPPSSIAVAVLGAPAPQAGAESGTAIGAVVSGATATGAAAPGTAPRGSPAGRLRLVPASGAAAEGEPSSPVPAARRPVEKSVPGVKYLRTLQTPGQDHVTYGGRIPYEGCNVWVTHGTVPPSTHLQMLIKHDQAIALAKHGTDPRLGSMPVNVVIEQYLNDRADKKSIDSDRSRLRLLAHQIGHMPVCEVRPATLIRVYDTLCGDKDALGNKRREHSTDNRYRAAAKAFFSWCHRRGLIESNPAKVLAMKPENPNRTRILNADEVADFDAGLQDSPVKVQLFCKFLLFTGGRSGEALHALHEDIDIRAATWVIPNSKSGRPRIVPLSDLALGVVRELQAIRVNPYLFPSRNGRSHMSRPGKRYAELLARAGIEGLRMHDLRRTFATWAVQADERDSTIHDVSRVLGHSSVKVTERYVATSPRCSRQVVVGAASMYQSSLAAAQARPSDPAGSLPASSSLTSSMEQA